VDSLFVEKESRGRGIGTELMSRALRWLEERKASSKIISVVYANEEAAAFYSRFNFFPATVLLRQKSQDCNHGGKREAKRRQVNVGSGSI